MLGQLYFLDRCRQVNNSSFLTFFCIYCSHGLAETLSLCFRDKARNILPGLVYDNLLLRSGGIAVIAQK